MKRIASLFFISLLSGSITLGAYKLFFEKTKPAGITVAPNFAKNVSLGAENVDFTTAADQAVHAVVHVKNVSTQKVYNDPFSFFFGGGRMQQEQYQIGTGSGVIISKDGYIVTNNHVIQNASELEITLNNNKSYKAKLIGTDSKMDIALLKIDATEDLHFVAFADSDAVQVGEWVLAVGNPYNLTSTVTAGIVSAKARNLSKEGIQSFIQTDAAVNPGNSGGALVNTRGELIGINTMISSQTGSYVGYSFAVPSNITRKIIEDLMQFGNVQHAVLGIEGGELNSSVAEELGVKQTQGVYISKVTKNSGAEKAGLQKEDIIIKIDENNINSFAELTAYIGTKRPNETVTVSVIRENEVKKIEVKLTKKELLIHEFNGIEFEEINEKEKQYFRLDKGVKIKSINNEEVQEYEDILKGSVILSIDGKKINDVETLTNYLNQKNNPKAKYQILSRNKQVLQIIM